MKKLIKFKLRRNLLYLFVYYITWITVVSLERISIYSFNDYNFIYLFLTILGKIIGGLITYLYQYHFLKRDKQVKYFGINLIYNKGKTKSKDKKTKIGALIFFASCFYVFRFIIVNRFAKYMKISPSIVFRLSSIQTISSALIYTYILGYEMKKHHKFSLIIISIFLILMFVVNILSKLKSINFNKYAYFNLFIFYYYICETFGNFIEKYLVDVDYINPFLILMLEGIFELILVGFYFCFSKNIYLFNEFKNFENTNGVKIFLRILPLIFYILISSISNVYKIYCNVIYSPMARSLINYLLNPIYIIFDFDDNTFYLVISIILSIIISFFGCVYNEYIILFCYDLEKETKDIIAERAENTENVPENNIYELYKNDNDSDSEKDNDNN